MVTATTEAIGRALTAAMDVATEVHHPAIAVPIAAAAFGAELVEYMRELNRQAPTAADLEYELAALARELK